MSRQQVAQPGFQAQAHNRQLPQEKKLPSEDLIMQKLQNQQVAIQNLENQMGQLANALITRPVGVFTSDTTYQEQKTKSPRPLCCIVVRSCLTYNLQQH